MDYAAAVGVLVALAGAALGYLRFATSRDARRTRRVLRKARVVPIAELVDGKLACIVGIVQIDGDPIESLISRRQCVAFDTTTFVYQPNEAGMLQRVTRRLVPFYVTDGTGRVRIDAPEVALCNRPVARGEQYEERILEDGATIRIVGSVSLDPTMQRDEKLFREGGFDARLTGTAKYPLLADVED